MKVMIVHCDAVIAAYLTTIISEFDCEVVGSAPMLEDAKREAERSKPDIAFVDAILADGSRGYRLAVHLAAQYRTYVVMMSHELDGHDITRFDGTFHWIKLPYAEADITEELGEALRTRFRSASLSIEQSRV